MTENQENSYESNSYHSHLDITTDSVWGFNIWDYYDLQSLKNMVSCPMQYNEELRHLSNELYSANGMLRNTIDYMVALPTLDSVIVNDSSNDTINKRSKRKIGNVLKTIKHKQIVRDILLNDCIDGIYFGYLNYHVVKPKKDMSDYDIRSITEINENEMNLSVISLPTDYCKIIGMRNNVYVVAFDLIYFNEGSETPENKIRKYPDDIKNAYNRWKTGKGKQWFILDWRKSIVHKISSKRIEPWGRPLVLGAISDILYDDYNTKTKRNILDNINNQIIYETFPEGKDKGTSALPQPKQEEQHNVIKRAVQTKNSKGGISFFSVAAGTKIDSINPNTDLLNNDDSINLTNKISTSLGFAASLLNASGTTSFSAQQTNLELVTAQIFQWIEEIETELNKVLYYALGFNTKNSVCVKYLPITHLNKKTMVSNAKELYLQGKGSLSLWAAACGISPDIFFALLNEELEEDIENKYPVHRTSYTQSGSDSPSNETGRPTIESTGGEITNPSTMTSRTNNANDIPSPSDRQMTK